VTIDFYARGALFAEKLIKERGITALHVDPFAVASDRGIEVVPKPAQPGVSGMLIRLGNDFLIAYATHIDNEPFQRFCVSHELGHYFLPEHPDAVFNDDGVHFSTAGFASKDRYEMEADGFAAGLLMPRSLFFPALQQAGSGFAAIKELAKLCKTSIHATAIRYVQCSRDPVAILVSSGGRIEHCFISFALKSALQIAHPRKGDALPSGTHTSILIGDGRKAASGQSIGQTSNLQNWFDIARPLEATEDAITFG
jgi:hypothetical protein